MHVILLYLLFLAYFDLISLITLHYSNYAHAFNIDEEYPIVISNTFNEKDAHFGASVVLLSGTGLGESENGDHHQGQNSDDITKGWVIIGAPKANSTNANHSSIFEPGLIWRCALGSFSNNSGSSNKRICEIVEMDPTGEYDPKDRGLPFQDKKDGGWLGGSMFVGESNKFVTCASRWINQKYNDQYLLNGICYWLPKTHLTEEETDDPYWPRLAPKLSYRLSPLLNRTKQTFKNTSPSGSVAAFDWAYGQFGFSIHLTADNELIAGAPGVYDWTGSIVYYKDTLAPRPLFRRYNEHPGSPAFSEVMVVPTGNISQLNSSDYFGYSVTSGKFFLPEISKNKTQFAVGAPRSSQLSGKVFTFTLEDIPERWSEGRMKFLVEPIEGKETNKGNHYASYFGHSLLALDVNADGFDDLLVSAPLYGTSIRYKRNAFMPMEQGDSGSNEKGNSTEEESRVKMKSGDEGCVFVYLSNGEEFILTPQAICGDKISGARFGMAISSLHDINDDGFNDLAIGAPYENEGRGAVYVYHGGQDFVLLAQKLIPETVDQSIRTFGWSLSYGMDIDENGYPDLAVGAYETNNVIIYRTIPIVHFTPTLSASIPKLLSTTGEFNIISCIAYTGRGRLPSVLGLNVKLTVEVDAEGKRIMAFVNEMDSTAQVSHQGHRSQKAGINRQLLFSIERLLNFRSNGAPTCYDFPAMSVGSFEGISRSVTIRQEYWLENSEESDGKSKPIHYEIYSQGISSTSGYPFSGVKFLNSKSDFNDFYRTKLPMPSGNMFGTERLILPVGTLCEADGDPECLANLTISAGLKDYNSDEVLNASQPFVLGSSDIVTLEVELTNHREVARPPITLALRWLQPPNVRRIPANCENKMSEFNQSYLVCTLKRSIKENEKEVVSIELDMSGVYGRPPEENQRLNIFLEGNANCSLIQQAKYNLSVPLQTQMKPQKFNHVSSKMEYSMGNVSIPTFGFTQAFEVGLDGPSTAAAIEVNFDIPVGVVLKGEEYRLIGVRVPIVTYDGAMHCTLVNGSFLDLDLSSIPSILKMTGGDLDFNLAPEHKDNENYDLDDGGISFMKMSEATAILKRNMKRVKRSVNEVGQSIWMTPEQENNVGTLKIHCNSRESSKADVETKCLRVKCVASHFTPQKKAVVEFKLRLFNDVATKLLDLDNHDDKLQDDIDSITSLWIESVGQVRTLDSSHGSKPFGEISTVRFTTRLEIPPPYELPAWILIVAVGGGLLTFTVVAILLKKCGFFRRSKRDELVQRKIEELERKQKVAKSPSSSSTVKMKTASRDEQHHRSILPNEYSDVTAQCSSNGGSILAVSMASPGTIAKQREMPGAVDLTELRRLYSYDENLEYY